jgi:uncharacterized protein YaaR (DUF327 family)
MSHVLASEPKLPKKADKTSPKGSFSKVLNKKVSASEDRLPHAVDLSIEELEELLDEVHILGETLVVEPSFSNVKRYKEKITEFLEHIVSNAIDLKSEKGQVRTDYRRSKYTIVHVINQKLERLAGSVLQNQSHQLKLLESIGEIQGLLIDLIR